jgi:type IV pilus biogenesis protein CpaD/CtpE
MKTVRLVNFVALLALAGCASDRPIGISAPYFGESVQHNLAASVVNPMAPMDNSPLNLDAQRAAIAQGRYVTDTVEQPALVGTQQTQAGGTGSGSTGATAGAAAR